MKLKRRELIAAGGLAAGALGFSQTLSRMGRGILAKKDPNEDKLNGFSHEPEYRVNKETGEVKFIHSATSRGVMVSSLDDKYWGPRYRFAQRVINENHISDYQSLAKNLN